MTALPESSVKAAFLYKFPTYIDWPQPLAAAEPFKIGVLDSLPVEHELQQLALSGSVAGHPITITEVKHHRDLEGLKLLFVGGQSIVRYSSLLLDAEKSGIVTVTEAEKPPALESIINFVVEQGRVRFTVSLPAAQRAGVQLSSRLLNVAKSVDRGTP